ncbi:hypothetical protein ACOMHN_055306 [Nucella lapillus]
MEFWYEGTAEWRKRWHVPRSKRYLHENSSVLLPSPSTTTIILGKCLSNTTAQVVLQESASFMLGPAERTRTGRFSVAEERFV